MGMEGKNSRDKVIKTLRFLQESLKQELKKYYTAQESTHPNLPMVNLDLFRSFETQMTTIRRTMLEKSGHVPDDQEIEELRRSIQNFIDDLQEKLYKEQSARPN